MVNRLPTEEQQVASEEATFIDDHFHNREVVFGLAAAPTATHFGDTHSLNPYVVTAGNGVFGTAIGILGTGDTPFFSGSTTFDVRKWSFTDVSNANPYILRVIWGSPTQTSAQAEAANQYSENIVHQLTANGQNKPEDIFFVRQPVGNQVWVKALAGGPGRTISLLCMMHEYPAPGI